MMTRILFQLTYAPITKRHLEAIDQKHHSLIRQSIETQLLVDPDIETRNRKPLKRPVRYGAKWEIRFGPDNRFRVFYKINHENHQVEILAIGEKQGNKLNIGGEEIDI
jgi:mRNA-degrading endonuclease RelE of RelBE toxin-antitoxin system